MIKASGNRKGLWLGLLAGGLGALASLTGCMGTVPQPVFPLDRRLEELGPSRAPSLAGPWLALIANRGGRDQVVLLNLDDQRPVPLPGLNRPDAQPLSVGVEAKGERFRLIGVGMSDLCEAADADHGDLVDTRAARDKATEAAVDSLRAKFGGAAVVKGIAFGPPRKPR